LPDPVNQLIEVAASHDAQLAAFLFVAASTGCRRGLLCGLRSSDVDAATTPVVADGHTRPAFTEHEAPGGTTAVGDHSRDSTLDHLD
jgi:integrase